VKALGLLPRRLKRERGRHALVDGIPFALPIRSMRMQALMAAFPIERDAARTLLPPSVSPVRLGRKSLLIVTVVNYQATVIGRYIEFSVALSCARRSSDPPPLLPFLLPGPFRFGQWVVDLPVSTEISVKGGKGIWGMPKHQANLDFEISDAAASSWYEKDGLFAVAIEVSRPRRLHLPMSMGASNYCEFRGMLMKSDVYFRGRAELGIGRAASARLELGDHPRVAPLKALDIGAKPVFTVVFPEAHGVLDDYVESWFLPFAEPPRDRPEGFESVIDLGLGEEWLPPPERRSSGWRSRRTSC
jgi:Acetoacetate decarboxylase (ADC)